MFFESYRKNECCGCTACLNACPTRAITMQEDKEGFYYPSVNEELCVQCNLCRKVCSWDHPKYENEVAPLTFASVLKDKVERQRSTSGGLFYAIAKWIIEQGGVVYGAAFDNNLQLNHIGVDNVTDLQLLRGSKYIQSNLGRVFLNVKENLEKGKWCYFSGTGCQVAGLKAYLRKEYSKLITSDVVCHGVPSQKIFNQHIKYLEKKYQDKVLKYLFRDYKLGGGSEIVSFRKRKPVINRTYFLSPYLYSFMYGYISRPSCYECKFAYIPRQGDITLADYWGVKHFFPKFDNSNGCSLLLLNTEKGRKLWDQIKISCKYEVSKIEDATLYNSNLTQPTNKPEIRDKVYLLIDEQGYDSVANQLFRSPNYIKLKIINNILNLSALKPLIYMYRRIKKCFYWI